MKDIKTIAGLTFKILIGVRLGKLCADVVSKASSKLALRYLDKAIDKLKGSQEEDTPHMELNK